MVSKKNVKSKQIVKSEKGKLKLKIVLDTNQLYTGSASDLLKEEVKKIIEETQKHSDVVIEWYLPEVVLLEREYQMLNAAINLLPSIRKLEKLLGHNLAINEAILESRVKDVIKKQTDTLGIKRIKPDFNNVDWGKVVEDAVFRRPPFERGKKEKGFRDAIIAETFLELSTVSPKSPGSCRLVLVTNDNLLSDAINERSRKSKNMNVLNSLEELRNFINTLVSKVTEEFVNKIRQIANDFFFDKDNDTCLYRQHEIRKKIIEDFRTKLDELPKNADEVKIISWYIGIPRFLGKRGQKVKWLSTVSAESEAYRHSEMITHDDPLPYMMPSFSKYELKPISEIVQWGQESQYSFPQSIESQYSSVNLPYSSVAGQQNIPPLSYSHEPQNKTREILVSTGRFVFHVVWSVTVTSKSKFTNPKIEDISYHDTTWE